jgi:hypothetical protein
MLVYRIAVFVAWGLLRFFWSSCRMLPVAGLDAAREALRVHRSVIPVYWHQHIVSRDSCTAPARAAWADARLSDHPIRGRHGAGDACAGSAAT